MSYVSCTDIVGYVDQDSGVLCASCVGSYAMEQEKKELSPIFAGDECDSFPTCDACHATIETLLTPDGIAYYLSRGKEGRDILDAAGIWYDYPNDDTEED